jgi:hypothetical protein
MDGEGDAETDANRHFQSQSHYIFMQKKGNNNGTGYYSSENKIILHARKAVYDFIFIFLMLRFILSRKPSSTSKY